MSTLFKNLMIVFGIMLFTISMAMSEQTNHSVVFKINQSEMLLNSSTVESAVINPPKNKTDGYGVTLKLKNSAADKFGDLTQANIGKQASILLNGTVISSAIIRNKLGREFLMAGLTKQQAYQFIKSLRLVKISHAPWDFSQ